MKEKVIKLNDDQEVKIVKDGVLLIAPEPINTELTKTLKEVFSTTTAEFIQNTMLGIKNISTTSSMNYINNKQEVLKRQLNEIEMQKKEIERNIINFIVQTEAKLDQINSMENMINEQLLQYKKDIEILKNHEKLDREQDIAEE